MAANVWLSEMVDRVLIHDCNSDSFIDADGNRFSARHIIEGGLMGPITGLSGITGGFSQLAQQQQGSVWGATQPIYYPASPQLILAKPNKPVKGKSMLQHARDYFGKNRDIIFNVAIIILVDHFVFKGAFREKIKNLLDGFLVKTHKMLDINNEEKPKV